MSGQDKSTSSTTNSSTNLTSSTANTLTSAINSTTSALTSTFSSLSSVLPLTTSQQNTQQQLQQQPQQSSSTKARRTTVSSQTSANSEIEKPSASDGTGNKSQNVSKLTEEMFSKVGEYLKGEVLATTEDYKLLETMNKVTRDRYKEMSGMAQNLVVEMAKLQKIYSDFEPYVQQIDEICDQVDFLEKVALELDEYSKDLESRLKKITK
ncbi:hypothetical protein RclHR1_12160003 [Rhizophagus clarus]|uniref:Biogenesis of lysosome-related organelles complex 1 subunit 2 isoform X1 n=1 Tax=Rhizophagus clarus TaxID=94130 RepID=A0A2Z6QYC8_9GLOM|nr:hypothetical protein RclHR1_12160003 [Rhizophagus clarus]GES86607.1 biogenesis of lysosome-related organelles complex 1 subunit 2 isoform X1 [Rhizophagus clarus]